MKFIPESKLQGAAMPRLLAEFRAHVVGQLVTQVGYVEISGEPYPALLLQNGMGLVVQQDDECNGPGTITGWKADGSDDVCLCHTSINPDRR